MAKEKVTTQEVVEGKEQVVAEAQEAEAQQEAATNDGDGMVTVKLDKDEIKALVRYQAGFLFDSDRFDKCCACMDGLLEEWRLEAWKRISYFGSLIGHKEAMEVLDDECERHLEEREYMMADDVEKETDGAER